VKFDRSYQKKQANKPDFSKKVTANPTKKCTGIKREEQNNKKDQKLWG
jgi:hypothetical protein